MLSNIRYSKFFNLPNEIFGKYGIFNGFVDKDANFYVVPHLLQECSIEEFKDAYDKYKKYFSDIIRLVKASKKPDDRFYREVKKRFTFHEIAQIGLGYSKTSKRGSGIGLSLAKELTNTAFEIVNAGIEDPEIFELIGLLEEGIGADRVSDMAISILAEEFLQYTTSMTKKLKIPYKEYEYKYKKYNLPFFKDDPLIFVPNQFLVALPMAIDRDDINTVCSHNEQLRERVNNIISQGMSEGNKLSKSQLKRLLISEPDIAKRLIKLIKQKIATPYDFQEDPEGTFLWQSIAQDIDKNFPIILKKEESPKQIVKKICNQYKKLIEDNGMFKFFHNSDGTYKKEKFAQMLFFSIAKSYCDANNLDLSPESDAGRGPVDFKISRGQKTKVNVELKLSSNSKLLHGYTTQLAIYDKAENTTNSFFLILILEENHMPRVEKVLKHKNQMANMKLPEIITIDTTLKKSASKALF